MIVIVNHDKWRYAITILSRAKNQADTMRSDSQLQIFIFRSEKRIGLLMQSDSAKSEGTKITYENPMVQVVDLGPWPNLTVGFSNRKKMSVFNQVKANKESLVQQ